MKGRYLLIGLLCVGLLAIIGSLYRIYRNFQALETVNRELLRMVSNPRQGGFMARLREAEFRSEGVRLDKKLCVRDENGDTVRLSEAVGGGTIVFRYSKYQCSACLDQQMLLLREKLAVEPGKLIVLSDYASEKEMDIFRGLYGFKGKIYAEISEWETPADSLDMPYYMFLEGNEMQIKDMFIPVKEDPSLSEYY